MKSDGTRAADVLEIHNLLAHSQHLTDTNGWDGLADDVFAAEVDGIMPEARFGFAVWRGTEGIRRGYRSSLPRFDAAAHVMSNLHLQIGEDVATARYYVQGWHWVRDDAAPARRANADFLLLGVMTDELLRQTAGWRIRCRTLVRLGRGVALGALPAWLDGVGDQSRSD
jgi:hypothetical protein